jgi:hypothetical protein
VLPFGILSMIKRSPRLPDGLVVITRGIQQHIMPDDSAEKEELEANKLVTDT